MAPPPLTETSRGTARRRHRTDRRTCNLRSNRRRISTGRWWRPRAGRTSDGDRKRSLSNENGLTVWTKVAATTPPGRRTSRVLGVLGADTIMAARRPCRRRMCARCTARCSPNLPRLLLEVIRTDRRVWRLARGNPIDGPASAIVI